MHLEPRLRPGELRMHAPDALFQFAERQLERAPLDAEIGREISAGAQAVVDALAQVRIRHIDMPITPEKVWNILNEKGLTSD